MDIGIFLSKLLPQLVYPLTVSLSLLVLAFLLLIVGRRQFVGICLALSMAILWIASTPPFAQALTVRLERQHMPIAVSESPSADAIVVLGGSVGLATPPRIVADLKESSDRVLHSARLYNAGKAPVVIVSGGNVFPQREAQPESFYIAELLVEWGVDDDGIVVEGASRNTYENAKETKRILLERDINTVLLVTSAMHMRRALSTFRSAGIDAIPSPTDFLVARHDRPAVLEWLPSADALKTTTVALKEYLGHFVYRWRGWIRDDV